MHISCGSAPDRPPPCLSNRGDVFTADTGLAARATFVAIVSAVTWARALPARLTWRSSVTPDKAWLGD
eukprot:776697-Prymnesium_polylepis.2